MVNGYHKEEMTWGNTFLSCPVKYVTSRYIREVS